MARAFSTPSSFNRRRARRRSTIWERTQQWAVRAAQRRAETQARELAESRAMASSYTAPATPAYLQNIRRRGAGAGVGVGVGAPREENAGQLELMAEVGQGSDDHQRYVTIGKSALGWLFGAMRIAVGGLNDFVRAAGRRALFLLPTLHPSFE